MAVLKGRATAPPTTRQTRSVRCSTPTGRPPTTSTLVPRWSTCTPRTRSSSMRASMSSTRGPAPTTRSSTGRPKIESRITVELPVGVSASMTFEKSGWTFSPKADLTVSTVLGSRDAKYTITGVSGYSNSFEARYTGRCSVKAEGRERLGPLRGGLLRRGQVEERPGQPCEDRTPPELLILNASTPFGPHPSGKSGGMKSGRGGAHECTAPSVVVGGVL